MGKMALTIRSIVKHQENGWRPGALFSIIAIGIFGGGIWLVAAINLGRLLGKQANTESFRSETRETDAALRIIGLNLDHVI